MAHFSEIDVESLGATASCAAAYLDDCDEGSEGVRLDPAYYQACGNLLKQIFILVDAWACFPRLMEHSAAAREVAETLKISHRIEISRLGFYPELTVLMNRVTA
ncbi:MAG: hypothetical protein ACM3X0_06760 [Bacteroidota bacterium]